MFCVILLLPDQVYVLSSCQNYLVLSFKLSCINNVDSISNLFWFLNDEILLHILHDVFRNCPWTGSHTHMQSPVSIDKPSEFIEDAKPHR